MDDDRVAESNLNRQILALTGTVGAQGGGGRRAHPADQPGLHGKSGGAVLHPETAYALPFEGADYVVDAVTGPGPEIGPGGKSGGSAAWHRQQAAPELLRLSVLEKTEAARWRG